MWWRRRPRSIGFGNDPRKGQTPYSVLSGDHFVSAMGRQRHSINASPGIALDPAIEGSVHTALSSQATSTYSLLILQPGHSLTARRESRPRPCRCVYVCTYMRIDLYMCTYIPIEPLSGVGDPTRGCCRCWHIAICRGSAATCLEIKHIDTHTTTTISYKR